MLGVELHACGVIDGGRGLLFIGNSGDGKTTTARLWQNETAEIVSDDRVIVRAENGGWTMYGTPWHGEADICSAASAPLHRIYVLDKSARNGVAQPMVGEPPNPYKGLRAFQELDEIRKLNGL